MKPLPKDYTGTGAKFALAAHRAVNQLYDGYLPYRFHLEMVVQAGRDFQYLIPDQDFIFLSGLFSALWNHDVLEDCHVTYNDLVKALGNHLVNVPEMVYAVTNEKGRTRSERANPKYYEGIRKNPYNIFVKLCDRIANVRYGKMFKSDMFYKYQREQDEFEQALGMTPLCWQWPMVEHLRELFKEQE